MTLQKKTYKKTVTILFLALLTLGIIFRVRMVPYGFHYFDEAYYYALPYRITQGDALFFEDWSFTQFSLISLYPLVKLYCSLTGGTEGLIVAGRYFFVFVHSVCTLAVYLLLQKNSPIKAMCAALLYFLYSHWYASMLSYYQIFMDMLLISALILASDGEIKKRAGIGGYFFAAAVLACPYVAAVYVLYTAACIVLKITRNEKDILSIKAWLYFTAGCAAAAVITAAFILSRADIKKLPQVTALFFGGSGDQVTVYTGKKTKTMLQLFIGEWKAVDFVLLALLLVEAADRNRVKRRKVYTAVLLAAAAFGTAAELAAGGLQKEDITLRLCILGLNSYLLCRKKDRKMLFTVWGFGWILGICLYTASDTRLKVMLLSGWIMSAMAGICFILQLVSEIVYDKAGKKSLKLCLSLLCAVLLLYQTGYEIKKNIPRIWELYCPLEYGIGKGELISEPEMVYEQEELWDATEKVRNAEGEYVLYFSDDSWPYLEDTKRCAAYTVWMQTENDIYMAEKLLKYWEIFPEKKPDAIYVTKNNDNPLEVIEIVNTENFPVEENDRGYVMIRPTKG